MRYSQTTKFLNCAHTQGVVSESIPSTSLLLLFDSVDGISSLLSSRLETFASLSTLLLPWTRPSPNSDAPARRKWIQIWKLALPAIPAASALSEHGPQLCEAMWWPSDGQADLWTWTLQQVPLSSWSHQSIRTDMEGWPFFRIAWVHSYIHFNTPVSNVHK